MTIDFLKYRWATLAFSLAILVTTVATYVYKKQVYGYAFNYSVEFSGGTQVRFKFEKPVSGPHLKEILENDGYRGVATREFGEKEAIVRIGLEKFSNDAKGLGVVIQDVLNKAMPENPASIVSTESVGAGVGEEFRWNSLLAVLISVLLMLMYIAFRFWSWAFAVGAVVALMHDAMVIVAAFMILDREISSAAIAAIITVIGYSINDTIVIFAQIRDTLAKSTGQPLYKIVNASLNITLRRTILTSFATALTVTAMFFGGEALRDFSLALLIGIIFGTYSSIYMASPVMMLLYREKK